MYSKVMSIIICLASHDFFYWSAFRPSCILTTYLIPTETKELLLPLARATHTSLPHSPIGTAPEPTPPPLSPSITCFLSRDINETFPQSSYSPYPSNQLAAIHYSYSSRPHIHSLPSHPIRNGPAPVGT